MIPLCLITGFLGAGKTTFLERILPGLAEKGVHPHVILNDYQNAEIDATRLARLTDLVMPISGSCVCCGSRDELLEMLESIPDDPEGVLLIEANGTTDTEELVEILTLDRRAERFSLPVQVVLIDARRWQKRFWHNGLEASQVRTATHGHITRMDLVSDRRKLEIRRSLLTLNPGLSEISPEDLAADLATLREAIADLPSRDHGRSQTTNGGAGTAANPSPQPAMNFRPADPNGPPVHHHFHFAAVEMRLKRLISERKLRHVLGSLPEAAVRAKGVCYFEASPEVARLFQRVGGAVDELQIFPLDAKPSVAPTAVVIGGSLDEAALRELFAELLE